MVSAQSATRSRDVPDSPSRFMLNNSSPIPIEKDAVGEDVVGVVEKPVGMVNGAERSDRRIDSVRDQRKMDTSHSPSHSKRTPGMSPASSAIRSLMLSRLRLSTALCDSRRLFFLSVS